MNKNNVNIDLKSIKFKFDIKELSLFLETKDPNINYNNLKIPAKNIKIYIDFSSLIKIQDQK